MFILNYYIIIHSLLQIFQLQNTGINKTNNGFENSMF